MELNEGQMKTLLRIQMSGVGIVVLILYVKMAMMWLLQIKMLL
jgi:hypothetical protein